MRNKQRKFIGWYMIIIWDDNQNAQLVWCLGDQNTTRSIQKPNTEVIYQSASSPTILRIWRREFG